MLRVRCKPSHVNQHNMANYNAIVLNLVASRLMSSLVLLKPCMSSGYLLVTMDKSC
jgi:hypothetical protein